MQRMHVFYSNSKTKPEKKLEFIYITTLETNFKNDWDCFLYFRNKKGNMHRTSYCTLFILNLTQNIKPNPNKVYMCVLYKFQYKNWRKSNKRYYPFSLNFKATPVPKTVKICFLFLIRYKYRNQIPIKLPYVFIPNRIQNIETNSKNIYIVLYKFQYKNWRKIQKGHIFLISNPILNSTPIAETLRTLFDNRIQKYKPNAEQAIIICHFHKIDYKRIRENFTSVVQWLQDNSWKIST